jgi:hypothetical protein
MVAKITTGKLVRFGIIFLLGIIGIIACLVVVDIAQPNYPPLRLTTQIIYDAVLAMAGGIFGGAVAVAYLNVFGLNTLLAK